ncbi:DNA replication and repair protein RecN [Frankia casuarinae]|uniref:DNA repair protein RecN n=2 Tax=Frankia casuarinae (strain DSM 45818 / CECT 9043 / HFP020203 / CcI3) TaxID=106370 RepID=Q2J877_FRACC|nr:MULTISPECIES: DNA repair protein RecN [Frankia]ABD12515.1 DNA replication and repair protein RecN [Frankia casuarinae]ETA00434.1 DNA replication and repair protein RecN [Frankia sp. CcI6]EYT90260.1 DNA replication and repair protein RecN [Frankia casuarinae]KDA42302.1 DNA replication and repair protein RecN [Frankia sp. BMG5.23]OFB42079.1 DNA repair protein RecN [Frankia sp. CgIM4]
MLEEIRIRGLGVIDDAALDLAPGLTVVSGETGAGKTMIVQGLGLLTGGRADYGLVRPGVDRAFVEGRLVIGAESAVAARVREVGGDLDEDPGGAVLVVGRTLTAEGRSRAQVAGRSVPASVLAEIAEELIAVHGQSEAQRLLKPSTQRDALDRFAGSAVAGPLARYGGVYRELTRVSRQLAEITDRVREREQEAELLRIGLDEVERIAPSPGEDVTLDAELTKLEHAETLVRAARTAHAALMSDPATGSDEPGAVDLVAAAQRVIAGESALDAELAALGTRLTEVGMLLTDVAADLASYAEGIDADPVRLADAQARKAALTSLTRAHGTGIDGVLAWADQAGRRLLELDGAGDSVEALTARRDSLTAELARLAEEVSEARTKAAARFGAAVAAELAGLAMPRARVEAAVSQRDDPAGLPVGLRVVAFGPFGVDDVELRLIPHPGAPPRPVQKGASGGELSRVMLAIEVVLAAADTGSTMVFDEVDAGVGGRAAVEIGRRLARLARTHQVICITHLPQVAAFADRHLVVHKADDGSVTRSGIVTLDDAGRVRELSRMLAGQEESPLARGHAEELLAAAEADKALP